MVGPAFWCLDLPGFTSCLGGIVLELFSTSLTAVRHWPASGNDPTSTRASLRRGRTAPGRSPAVQQYTPATDSPVHRATRRHASSTVIVDAAHHRQVLGSRHQPGWLQSRSNFPSRPARVSAAHSSTRRPACPPRSTCRSSVPACSCRLTGDGEGTFWRLRVSWIATCRQVWSNPYALGSEEDGRGNVRVEGHSR